ncbi:MAG TPA: hypothetical protein VFY03_12720 [Woeseiaceae bacterium]|nr:hypothetical protein [Woeseiaceae bacterium]
MAHDFACFRCGASLGAMSLPFSRRDQCPDCGVDLHVCRMCSHFDKRVARQCREDGAEDVKEKEKANFCDWFKPSQGAFDPGRKSEADKAREALEALFSRPKDAD